MYISTLSIRNYRNFKNVSLKFTKGVNTIIGENGSGKTNLFQALRLLIDDSLPRNIKFIESDFNRGLKDWHGHWIIIQLEFNDLDSGEEAQILAMHKIGNPEEVDSKIGTYCLYFRPKIDIRRKLFELSNLPAKESTQLAKILENISLNDYETCYSGKGNVDFSIDENYNQYIGEFDRIIFPDPDDEKTDVFGIRMYGVTIPNELSCTYAKALRDVESEIRSFRDNPLLNLLRNKEKKIKIEDKQDISEKIESLNSRISNLNEIKAISQGISDSVHEAVGVTYAPNVNIKSELPSEMEKLLQSLKLWVGDPDDEGYEGRLWELSLGGANLIYISLKLLEFEKVKQEDKIANFILIEEPEAHIHTHIQKTLFNRLNKRNTQVFVTTHSTHISSVSKIRSVNILSRSSQKAIVFSPSCNLKPEEVIRLERYLDAVRTNLLFARGVILVEGDAEQILIPEIIRSVFGVTLDEIGISLINIGSTGFKNVARIFHNDRIQRKCSIITDLDSSIVDLPKDSSDDDEYQKGCRNSELSGKIRKEELESFCDSNEWVKPFFAKYTFEVDFLLANNSVELSQTIRKAYKRDADLERILPLLKDKKVEISGKEVLRLANKFGKGWFALMVSDYIDNITGVPDYILDGLAFASSHLNSQVLTSIAKYRINAFKKRTFEKDQKDYNKLSLEYEKIDSIADALEFYKEELPNDVLTHFLNRI